MPAHRMYSLWLAIDVLETQEIIAQNRVAIYPHMTKAARAERDKKLYSAAYPKDIYKREAKSGQFLLQKLGGSGGRRK